MDTNKDRRGFRVWDSKEKCYVDTEYDYVYSVLRGDGSVEVYRRARGEIYLDDDSYEGCYIPEQCTGLKDQDSKLIHENDRLHYEHDGLAFDCVVEWHGGGWCVREGKNIAPLGDFVPVLFDVPQKITGPASFCKIVGTIHDKEKKDEQQG